MKKRDQTLRLRAFKIDNYTCQKCKFQDKTMNKIEAHHIIPLYAGGKDDLSNLITLCFDCHHYAPDKKEEFEEYMKDEMEGTLTILMKVWKKIREENPELFQKVQEKLEK